MKGDLLDVMLLLTCTTLYRLKKLGAGDKLVVVGGVIPQQDYQFLYDQGVSCIFGPGTKIPLAAQEVVQKILASLQQTSDRK